MRHFRQPLSEWRQSMVDAKHFSSISHGNLYLRKLAPTLSSIQRILHELPDCRVEALPGLKRTVTVRQKLPHHILVAYKHLHWSLMSQAGYSDRTYIVEARDVLILGEKFCGAFLLQNIRLLGHRFSSHYA